MSQNYHKKVVTYKLQHFYHKEVIFDADVKVENYYHHDEEQLLFYKKVYTE